MEAFGCVKNTIRLRSGRYFDLRNPQPEQFTLADIAGALSKMCRFGGQIDRFYSVAEHSCLCCWQTVQDGACEGVQRAALMHDAAEAFIGDVVKPLKVMLPEYAAIEGAVEYVIRSKYRLLTGPETWAAVKEIDRAMLIAERRALFTADGVEWTGERGCRALSMECGFSCWEPELAEECFLRYAAKLGIADGV